MKGVSRDNSAFWYIVLQPSVLKNESNCAIVDLAPNQMILVEKLWVLGPNMVLAQVLYPAKGYVPRENSICGQLITRLVPGGPQVPEELLRTKPMEIDNATDDSNHCLFNPRANDFSPTDYQTGFMTYALPGMIPPWCSNPLTGNKCADGPLDPPKNRNQRTQYLTCHGTNGQALASNGSQSVNTPSELPPGASSNVSNLHTRQQLNMSRCTCNLFRNSLVDQDWRASGWAPEYHCSSGHSQCMLSFLPQARHFITNNRDFEETDDFKSWYRVYHGFNHLSCPRNPDVSSDTKSGCCTKQLPARKSLIERLLSIYQSGDVRAKFGIEKETEKANELQNTVSTNQTSQAKAKCDEKLHVAAQCKYRRQWRYDPDRWMTVSALCNSLQVICRKNKQKVTPNDFQPNMIFHSPSIPDISLPAYLKRIAWFLGCPSACFVLALEYVHRLTQCCPEVEVNDYSVHQIGITCIMVATKFIYDKLLKNTFYARVAGLPVSSLSAFEVQLVFLLKFDLRVLPEQYNARYHSMLAENQGSGMVVIRPEAVADEADIN